MSHKKVLVHKYTFLHFFDRPLMFWHLTNEEIEAIFKNYSKELNVNDNNYIVEDSSQDMDESIEFDPIEIFQNSKNIKLTDENNPRFIEGKILNEKFNDFFINYNKRTLNIFNVIDFDVIYPSDKFGIHDKAQNILKTILSVKEPTLFLNPIFIFNSAIAAPAAITFVKEAHYEINFVKGSTGTKRSDILGCYFQIEIVKKNIPNLKSGSLFLIAKERKPKGSVSFTITNSIELTKNNKQTQEFSQNLISNDYKSALNVDELLNEEKTKKNKPRLTIKIDDLIKANKWSELENIENINSVRYKNFLKEYKKVVDNFWNIIDQISTAKISTNLFVPLTSNFESYWLKFPYQREVRKIWGLDNELFSYSGKVISLEKAFKFVNLWKKPNLKISLETYLSLNIFPTLINFYKLFLKQYYENNSKKFFQISNWSDDLINNLFQIINNDFLDKSFTSNSWTIQETNWFKLIRYPKQIFEKITYFIDENKLFLPLKKKKIYFDFETINPVIRATDNSFPFAQIITQCSFIKDDGNNSSLKCTNLIVDPKNISKEFFKKIIDSLYVENCYEYDFVVYNASFESNRLKELKEYLQDPVYNKKIDAIVANLYDLADWFNVNSSKWFIWIKELLGYYSIKNILSLLPKRCLEDSKTISYKSLNVQRGDKAQALTSLRFLNVIDDKKWSSISQDLCAYCENDVRAMIAVEKFGIELIENSKNKFNNFDIHLDIFSLLASSLKEPKETLLQNFLNKLSKLSKLDFENIILQIESELGVMETKLKEWSSLIK